MRKPKFDYEKITDNFDRLYCMLGMCLSADIKSSIEEKGMPFIKELGNKIKCGYEKIDKVVSKSENEEFQIWYAARINAIRPYLEMVKEAAELADTAHDDADRLIAFSKACASIPTTLGMLKALEDTFTMSGLAV